MNSLCTHKGTILENISRFAKQLEEYIPNNNELSHKVFFTKKGKINYCSYMTKRAKRKRGYFTKVFRVLLALFAFCFVYLVALFIHFVTFKVHTIQVIILRIT